MKNNKTRKILITRDVIWTNRKEEESEQKHEEDNNNKRIKLEEQEIIFERDENVIDEELAELMTNLFNVL